MFREAAASQKTFSSPGSDLIPHPVYSPVLPSQASPCLGELEMAGSGDVYNDGAIKL